MNKKICYLITLILCVCFIFSEATALDSPWDHYNGPIVKKDSAETVTGTEVTAEPEKPSAASGLQTTGQEPEPKNDIPDLPELPVIGELFDEPSTAGSLTLNDIQLYGNTDPSVENTLRMLSGLKIAYSNQNGDTPRSSFEISLPDTMILSYSLQKGQPYFVSTNLFGDDTYMIYDEDQFEEKLAASIYSLVEQMSEGSETNLPPLEEIQSGIAGIREVISSLSNGEITPTAKIDFQLDEEINPTALMNGIMPIMEKFGVDDPTADIAYTYMDYSAYFTYDWPAVSTLPQPGKAVSAISGILDKEDLMGLIDQLPIFFEDNPGLAQKINEALAESMTANPEFTEKYGNDFVGGFITELRNGMNESLEGFSLKFKMDQDANGAPVLITIWAGQQAEGGNGEPVSGMKVTVMLASSDDGMGFEIAADAFQDLQTMPLFRTVVNAASNKVTVNSIFGTDPSSLMEYAQVTDLADYMTGTSSSDTVIDFKISEFSMHMSIYKVNKPTLFDVDNQTTVTDLTVSTSGEPVFSITLTSEKETNEPMAKLTAADAIAASAMTTADYDTLAQTIFMQLMNLVMIFG